MKIKLEQIKEVAMNNKTKIALGVVTVGALVGLGVWANGAAIITPEAMEEITKATTEGAEDLAEQLAK